MESMGLCAKASSPWASLLHMVTKQDGSWRSCGDYRRLNLISVPDQYPMPNITDLTNNIGNAYIFTKLDLLKGYFQVPVHPDDVPKTSLHSAAMHVFYYSTFGLPFSASWILLSIIVSRHCILLRNYITPHVYCILLNYSAVSRHCIS